MWVDLQQTFWIVMGEFIVFLLLPAFISGGVLLALVMLLLKVFKRQ